MISMLYSFLDKILRCSTHKRFKKLFDKIEKESFRLLVFEETNSPNYAMKVKRNLKNYAKINELYEKFKK
jgi:hypothetical protein